MLALLSVVATGSLLSPVSLRAPTPMLSPLIARAPAQHARARGLVLFNEPPPEEPDDDAFSEIMNELTSLQKTLKPLPPLVFGAGVNAVTVLSALLAWFVTPPIGRIAAAGSLAIGGVAGNRVGKRLRDARRGVVPAAIAEMVQLDGVAGLKPKLVAKLADEYSVDPVEFEKQLSSVYARYLRQLLDDSEGAPNMAMVRELGTLRRNIGLRWNATSVVHEDEARAFLDGGAPPEDLASLPAELKALLWLSSALYATSKQQAGTGELNALLGADAAASQTVLNDISRPIYRSAVLQAVGKYNRTEAPEVRSRRISNPPALADGTLAR